MTNLSTLLKKSKELHRQQIDIEYQLAEIDRQILAAEAPPKTRRRNTQKEPRDIGEAIRAVVRVLCESSESLAPREIASRLGIEAGLASQRLHRAVKLGLIERSGNARYRATADTKSAVAIVDR